MGKQNILMCGETPRTLTLPPLPKLDESCILVNEKTPCFWTVNEFTLPKKIKT